MKVKFKIILFILILLVLETGPIIFYSQKIAYAYDWGYYNWEYSYSTPQNLSNDYNYNNYNQNLNYNFFDYSNSWNWNYSYDWNYSSSQYNSSQYNYNYNYYDSYSNYGNNNYPSYFNYYDLNNLNQNQNYNSNYFDYNSYNQWQWNYFAYPNQSNRLNQSNYYNYNFNNYTNNSYNYTSADNSNLFNENNFNNFNNFNDFNLNLNNDQFYYNNNQQPSYNNEFNEYQDDSQNLVNSNFYDNNQVGTPILSINKNNFVITDTWQLTLTSAPPNQLVYICAISNLGIQSCSSALSLGLQAMTDSFGNWSASGNWIKNGVPDESVIGNWTEWIVVGGKLENGQVIGGIRSNNINFTISKQTLSPQNPTLLQNSSLGVYIWGDLPQTSNPLKTAVDDALSLGVKTVRITLSPCFWDPKGISSNPQPLYNQILRDDYSYVFRNFSTVMATIYPLSICDFNSGQPYYRLSPDIIPETRWQEILNNVYNEIKQTVITAKINYPNTTIIWSNWEMENDCQDNQWQRCVEYQKTRLKAINSASLETQNFGGSGKEYSAIEFILLEKNWVPRWIPEWGPPPPPRQNSGLITAVEDLKGLWDFISYSSWNSMYHTEDPNWRPNKKFTSAFNIIRQTCYNAGIDCSDKIIIGEVGTLYDYDKDNSLLYEAISTSIKESAKFIYNWNLYDQISKGTLITPDGKQYDQSKFGKFDLNRILTPQGKAFKEWLLGNF